LGHSIGLPSLAGPEMAGAKASCGTVGAHASVSVKLRANSLDFAI